jgi:hypothetical protein
VRLRQSRAPDPSPRIILVKQPFELCGELSQYGVKDGLGPAAGIAAATASVPTLAALAPAATARKRRRFVSIGVFVGGVLSTRSARVIGGLSLWLGLEPGRKLTLPLGLLLRYR